MSDTKRVRLRRGTEQEHQSFAGVPAEVTYDTTKGTLRVHDGTTVGGLEISKARYEFVNAPTTLKANVKYLTDTTASGFTVTLPTIKSPGDFISIVDAEAYWGINNLMVMTQNGEEFKDFTEMIDSPLMCNVSGASVELIWEGNYWRVMA